MSDLSSKTQLYCPTCGNKSVADNKCAECEWVGCESDDHQWAHEPGDRSVGLVSYIECMYCGLEIDDDGLFDQEDDYP